MTDRGMTQYVDIRRLGRVLTVLVHEGRVSETEARAAFRKRTLAPLFEAPALNPYDRALLRERPRER